MPANSKYIMSTSRRFNETSNPFDYHSTTGSNHSVGHKSSAGVKYCGHLLAAFEIESTGQKFKVKDRRITDVPEIGVYKLGDNNDRTDNKCRNINCQFYRAGH